MRFLWTLQTVERSCVLSRTWLWSLLKLVALGDNSKYWQVRTALPPFIPPALLSPSHQGCIEMLFSLKMFAFSDDLSLLPYVFLLREMSFAFAQNSLSLTQGSSIRTTPVSEAPHVFSDWVNLAPPTQQTCRLPGLISLLLLPASSPCHR